MLIGELARRAGVSVDTIRFYEKKGLLDQKHIIRRGSTYKDYGPATLDRLQLISRAKHAGFTLSEIVQWLLEWHTLSAEEREKVFLAKIRQVDERMAELEKMKGYLVAKLAASAK